MNHRINQAKGLVYFTPRLRVRYRPRASLKALSRQYFEYGRWRRVVSRAHRGTVNLRYLAPPVALVGVVVGTAAGVTVTPWALVLPLGYVGLVVAGSVVIGRGLSAGDRAWLPLVLGTMHMSWGAGFLTSPRSLVPESLRTPPEQPAQASRVPSGLWARRARDSTAARNRSIASSPVGPEVRRELGPNGSLGVGARAQVAEEGVQPGQPGVEQHAGRRRRRGLAQLGTRPVAGVEHGVRPAGREPVREHRRDVGEQQVGMGEAVEQPRVATRHDPVLRTGPRGACLRGDRARGPQPREDLPVRRANGGVAGAGQRVRAVDDPQAR